jgi:hypothetical protein
MSFNTVGELIDLLQNYDRATPILKMCGTKFYFDVDFHKNLTYRVKETEREGRYIDAPRTDPDSFDAIVF